MSDDVQRAEAGSASGSEKAAAYFLWVVIALALVYGVAQTITKVAALFSG